MTILLSRQRNGRGQRLPFPNGHLRADGHTATIRAMRWLMHGNLTPAVGEALRRHGHTAQDAAELGISADDPAELYKAASLKQLDLITADQVLANAPFGEQGAAFARSVVFLQLEGGDVEQDDAVDRLFKRYKRLTPGRLYTVTATRVKIRQLPNK